MLGLRVLGLRVLGLRVLGLLREGDLSGIGREVARSRVGVVCSGRGRGLAARFSEAGRLFERGFEAESVTGSVGERRAVFGAVVEEGASGEPVEVRRQRVGESVRQPVGGSVGGVE